MKSKALSRGNYIFKSLVLSFILTFILVLIISLLLTYTTLKESRIPILNTITMVISITAGSVYMAVKVEEKGWLNGGILGALYFIILLLLNYLFVKPFTLDIYAVSKFVIALITGVIGGMIGVNIK